MFGMKMRKEMQKGTEDDSLISAEIAKRSVEEDALKNASERKAKLKDSVKAINSASTKSLVLNNKIVRVYDDYLDVRAKMLKKKASIAQSKAKIKRLKEQKRKNSIWG